MFAIALIAGLAVLGSPAQGAQTIHIELVDGRDGSRVAGAEVFVREVETARKRVGRRRLDLLEYERDLLAEGVALRADANGVAVFSPAGAELELELLARAPGMFGVDAIRSRTSTHRVVLRADHELRARVVDQDGAPAPGVPVCLRWRWGPLEAALLSVESGADGVALLPHAGYLRAAELRLVPASEVLVALDLCLNQDVSIAYDGPTAAPIELRLPPTRQVEVLFVGPGGAPLQRAHAIRLGRNEGLARRFVAWEPDAERVVGAVRAEAGQGRAQFRQVEPGQELLASGKRNEASAPRWTAFELPAAPGPVVVVLALDDGLASVVGRLVDSDGAALANARVELGPSPSWKALETDASGGFALEVELGQDRTVELRHRRADGEWIVARITLAALEARRTLRFGDARLARPPVLASGRVVRADGTSVVGARVVRRPESLAPWIPEERDQARGAYDAETDTAGRFELRELFGGVSFDLAVEARAGLPRRTTAHGVSPGARDLVIVLGFSGWVEGRARSRICGPRGSSSTSIRARSSWLGGARPSTCSSRRRVIASRASRSAARPASSRSSAPPSSRCGSTRRRARSPTGSA